MSCNNHNTVTMNPVVRLLLALSLTLGALCVSPAAWALDSGDIVVTSLKGEVHVTVNGAARAMKAGGVLETPASIRTGRDGSVELKQGATTVSVGPETLLEFPALAQRGGPVDRVVQPRGNAFYSIGKREGRKLRVETPYLVGVVKGTQFNVAAQDDSTTISLFEGRLEVRASDDSDVVDLNAGEIATRKRGDKSISVMKMDGKAPTNAPRPSSSGNGSGGDGGSTPTRPVRADEDSVVVGRGVNVAPVISASIDTPVGNTSANVALDVRANAAELNTDANVSVSTPAGSVDVGAGVDVGSSGVSVDAGAAVNVAPLGVDVTTSTGVDVGAGGVDVGTSTAVDAGPVVADVGASAAVDVDTGGIAADVDAGASVGLGGATVVDTSTNVGVDLGADTTATVDTGATVAGVDAGVSTAVDVGAGAVDLGLNVAGVDLGVGVDLGLDDTTASTPDTTTDTTTTTTVIDDVGGLLDGLLRRRPK